MLNPASRQAHSGGVMRSSLRFSSPTGFAVRAAFCALYGFALLPHAAIAGEADCGVLQNYAEVGPWDYHDPSNRMPTGADPMGRVLRVENVHFHPEIRNVDLQRAGPEKIEAELAYVLRVFPNHPYALYALSRLEKRLNGKLPGKAITPYTPKITAECFFDRAMRFRPDDKTSHMIYAMHLHDRKRYQDALAEYQTAERLGEDSPSFFYNFGLYYADQRDWDNAVKYAQKAYEQNFPLDGLRKKIQLAGRTIPVAVVSAPQKEADASEQQATPDPAQSATP
jgi:hypothetical protein